jgi:hypothetical protein
VAALYLFAEGYATLSSVRFWASLARPSIRARAKRLFGVIGGFRYGGMILGGCSAAGSVVGGSGCSP